MPSRKRIAQKNLDVPETSQDQVIQAAKRSAGDLAYRPLLSVVCSTEQREEQHPQPYRPHGTKYLSWDQATNLVEAVGYAKKIGRHLVAHATIHWSGTVAFDDPDGKRFAKVREGFNKYLRRRGGSFVAPCKPAH